MEWLNKKEGDRVILFFNGWGMDASAVKDLFAGCDVVMFYDYSILENGQIPSFSGYREVYVVAWSMGVWAASHLLRLSGIQPVASVALNGTERPVNDQFGIPLNIYLLTEKGMNERGREKFFCRMFGEKPDYARFSENKPHRDIAGVCGELEAIRLNSAGDSCEIKWDIAYIGEKDIIFPTANQLNWWQGRTCIKMLNTGHYPFYSFQSWEELIQIAK